MRPAEYLRANYERDDWLAVVLIYRQTGIQLVKQEFATAETIAAPRYQAHLRAANANGADIYLTVNALKPGATGRTKADVETVRHVFLDLDGGGREAVDQILEADGMPHPHHVLNTSPDKHQVIWSVEGFEREQAERSGAGNGAPVWGRPGGVGHRTGIADSGIPEPQVRSDPALRPGSAGPTASGA